MSLENQYDSFLKSQSLWKEEAFFNISLFHLEQGISNISNVSNINIPKNEVLGKRIELFFEHYIHAHSRYQLILKNLQIFRNKITIGELDFLMRDVINEQTLHVELVYKFYIYDPEISTIELEKWIGPNRKDSLLQKVSKLKEKQLPLLYQPETISILRELYIDINTVKQQICYLGNLFIPFSYKNKKIPLLNNECIQGFWIHSKDFISEKYNSYLFHIPEKKDWILNPTPADDWVTYNSIKDMLENHISKKKTSLLWMRSKEDIFTKLFVVWW